MPLTAEINIRDPFVLVHEGAYYLYGTRGPTCWGPADGFDVYVSRDLAHWSEPVCCFHNDGSFWADRNYWAPEVHPWRGRFYLFASFKREGFCRGTAILVSDSPLGPFAPHSRGPVTPPDWECLDGTFYVNRAGEPYMVFCHEWVQAGDGAVCAVRLSDDLTRAVGNPTVLFHASDAPWSRPVHHSSGVDGSVTDGPFLWRTADGALLCLWAGFSQTGYTQGVAVSQSGEIDGPFVQAPPLFTRDGGHGMIFRALDGTLYITLHTPNEHLLERPAFHPVQEENGLLVRARGAKQTNESEERSMEAKVVYTQDVPLKDLGGGVRRRVLAYNEQLMIVEVHFEKGSVGSVHTHPHFQSTYVKSGRFRFEMDGREAEVGPGDTLAFPGGVSHGTVCLEEGVLLDIFTPMREDFVK